MILLLTFCSIFIFHGQTYASELTLFVYPPKKELNWESPKKVLWGFLGTQLIRILFPGEKITADNPDNEAYSVDQYYKSSIGHTIAHIKCETSDKIIFDTWTSFSGQNFIEVDKENLLKEKLGLGTLFYDYIDGHIIKGEENIKRLVYYTADKRDGKKTRPRYLRVSINEKQCDELKKMVTFFESFNYAKTMSLQELKKRPKQDILYFSTNLDPYTSYLERQHNPKALVGGGCAPYGVSMLKLIGEYDPSLENEFLLRLKISKDQFGTPENPISLKSLLFGERGDHWIFRNQDYKEMNQYDPAHIWTFIGKLSSCIAGNPCEIESNEWFNKNRSRLENGPSIIFKDTRLSRRVETNARGNMREVLRPVTTEVKIDGVILKSQP